MCYETESIFFLHLNLCNVVSLSRPVVVVYPEDY